MANRLNQISTNHAGGRSIPRRPFWLPASNYYMLAAAVAIAFFFIVWGILNDGIDETPWITAGIGASVFLCGAILLREVILRRARNQFLHRQRSLDRSVRGIAMQYAENNDAGKLTLEKNRIILGEIEKKSEAAKVLGKFSDGHREVFELCEEYLEAAARELPRVGVGSPRLPALLRGKETVGEFHRFHVLRWAELETRSLMNDARSSAKIAEKIETAQRALTVLDYALKFYPDERTLLESESVLRDFTVSVKVSDWADKAERALFKGNHKRALSLYQDALHFVSKEEPLSNEREMAKTAINEKIARINLLKENM